MRTIGYIHGFASAVSHDKEQQLRQLFPDYQIVMIQYQSNDRPSIIIDSIIDQINGCDLDWTTLIGTSLGGWFARIVGGIVGTTVAMINPVIDPAVDLRQFIGTNKNYATGDTFDITRSTIDEYRDYWPHDGIPTVGWVSNNDPIIVDSVYRAVTSRMIGKIYITNSQHHITSFVDQLPNFVDEINAINGMIVS